MLYKFILKNSIIFLKLIINTKSSPILKSNVEHLIMKNKVWKNKIVHDYFEHVKDLLKHHQFASNLGHWNFASIGAYSKKTFWQSNLLCSFCDSSKIQNYSFKYYPHIYGSFYYVYKFIYDAIFFQDCDFIHRLGLIINYFVVFSSMWKGFMC